MFAGTPQLQGNFPTRLFSPADDLDDLVEPAPVMPFQDFDASGRVRVWASMRRKDQLRLVGGQASNAVQVLVEGIRGALRMQPDVRRKVRQHGVAGEQQLLFPVVQADLARRMPGRPFHSPLPSTYSKTPTAAPLHRGPA